MAGACGLLQLSPCGLATSEGGQQPPRPSSARGADEHPAEGSDFPFWCLAGRVCAFTGSPSRFSLLHVALSVFRPPHSLCWGSLLGAHPQHLAAGDPGKIHTGTAWGRVLCRKKGTLVAFGVSKHCRGKEGERHCSTTGLVADACLPLDLHLFGFWLSQEDLAGRQATRASYCPAVWQLLLHCENVDTRREPLSPSGRSGRLARSRKGSPPGGQSRKEGSSPGALQPARGVCRRQLRPERQVRAELGALLGHGMSRWACREWRHPVGF